jgi:hypothetical protein
MATPILDLYLPLSELKYTVFNLALNTRDLLPEMMCNLYDGLIHARHDLLHYFSLRAMGKKWEPEKKLCEILPIVLPDDYKNKTPDMVIYNEENLSINLVDFSVSIDTHNTKKNKQLKYMPICEIIKNSGYSSEFIHINIRGDFKNLDFELDKIRNMFTKDFETTDFIQLCECLDEKKKQIGRDIDPVFLEKYKNDKTMSITELKRNQTIQVSSQMPKKHTTLFLVNNPGILLQYMMDKETFIKDKRRVVSRLSLEKDVGEIMDKYGSEIETAKTKTMALLSIYNDLMITKTKRNIHYTYDRKCLTLQDFIIASLRNNYHPGMVSRVNITNRCSILDPTTMTMLFTKQHRLTKDYHRQCVDNICLIHVYLTHVRKLNRTECIDILNKIEFDTMDGNKKNYLEILSDINIDYMSMHDYNLTERKTVAYLNAYYRNNMTQLMELVNTNYTFSYKYNEKAVFRGGKYIGRTIVTYTHFNTTIRAYHDEKYGEPIMVCNRHFPSVAPILYNVALRLTNCISENDFETRSKEDKRKTISGKEIKEKISVLGMSLASHIIKPGIGDHDILTKISEIKDNDLYYPILVTQKTLMRETGSKFSRNTAFPYVDNNKLLVSLGKTKLFVLPYWKCMQFDNMIVINDVFVGVPLSELLQNRRLEYYILNTHRLKHDKFLLPELPTEELLKKIKECIKEKKLYDLKYSSIVKDSDEIKDLLDSTGQIIQLNLFLKSINREFVEIDGKGKEEEENIQTPFDLYGMNTDFDFIVEEENNNPTGEFIWGLMDDEEQGFVHEKEPEGKLNTENMDLFITPEDQIVDDIAETIQEGLVYHNREYIGNDVYHKELFGSKMDDNFIIDPKQKIKGRKNQKKTDLEFYSKMGSNYMVHRLHTLPDIYLNMYMINNKINMDNDLMTIYNIQLSLKNINECLNYLKYVEDIKNKDEIIVYLYFMLEKILCRTYITDKLNHKQSVGFAFDEKGTIFLGVWLGNRGKLTDDQIQNAKKAGKILHVEEDFLLVRTNIGNFEKTIQQGLASGCLTQQKPHLSFHADNCILKVINRKNDDIRRDLLNDLMGF